MSINETTVPESCVTCGVTTFGVDMCDDCENIESITCPQCEELATPYDMYLNSMCSRCDEQSEFNYEREHASLAQWYANNN